MGLKENMAAFIREAMEREQKSLSEFSEELDIGRNSLYAYSRGEGNPTIATLEHIADKLKISPELLVLGVFDTSEGEPDLLLLHTVKGVAELSQEKRQRFAQLFTEMVDLWSED